MSAIITDQIRIFNAKNFVKSVSSDSTCYSFIGLPNATEFQSDWDSDPPSPRDCFDQYNDYWDSMIALKRIISSDVNLIVKKTDWESGEIYDMYRHDISIDKPSPQTNATSLYSSKYYVVTDENKVYICLYNGASPENNYKGEQSRDKPTFIDLEPRSAGDDGYIWKYLYTIKPSEIIKFDSIYYIPVPSDWETNSTYSAIRENASLGGQIKIVTIRNRGESLQSNKTYVGVPIKGNGSGAEVTIVTGETGQVSDVYVSKGGSGYTFGTVDIEAGNLPSTDRPPAFDVIIPPPGGHGYDIYRELGSSNVLLYSRIENDTTNPDFITGNQIARIGIVENPLKPNSNEVLDSNYVSSVYAMRLIGPQGSTDLFKTTTFDADSVITQTIGLGITAVGRVISYDKKTGVLKYWQDRRLAGFNTNGTPNSSPVYGFGLNRFNSDVSNKIIVGGSNDLVIDDTFGQLENPSTTITINSVQYQLGQSFVKGLSSPEVQKYSGNIIFVDNRPSITRSTNQKEDIKVVLQF
jgi:hypothetical protein